MKTANALNLLLASALLCACAALWLRTAGTPCGTAAASAPGAEDAALPPRVDPDAPESDLPFHGAATLPPPPSPPPAPPSPVEAALAAIRAVPDVEGTAPAATSAAPGAAFREFDVHRDFEVNPFTYFTGKGLLLCAGDRERSNAMTIGWGGLGTLWGRNDAVTVYVAESRHTRGFMDAAERFTVMGFDKTAQAGILEYMGSHSGRDGDKAAALGLHTAFTPDGTPYYEEAQVVLECELMYAHPFDPKGFRGVPAKLYENFPAGVHTLYIGRIVRAFKK